MLSSANAVHAGPGSVAALWRYPVKSMMGEALNAAALTEHGVWGDRAYALIDAADGRVASAKNPRKWPGLFDYRATLADAPPVATPPTDGPPRRCASPCRTARP